MPRLFTGIKIPLNIANRLRFLQSGLTGARWIEAEDFHITLRFFGEVDGVMADEIFYGFQKIKPPSFDVELHSTGVFGSKKPRMVWAGVRPNEALEDLHRSQEVLAQKIGLPAEGRKFTPHVTLARLRHGDIDEVGHYLAYHGSFCSEPFRVSEFVLYSARNSKGGGPYVIEETYSLSDS